ncbi:MAG: hypothetical protein ACREEB_17750 [Caulobacteraceae bacterium]
MTYCIFCDTVLDEETTPEHVILSALGGRKTTKRADCSHHNNAFGGGIDKAIADQVPVIRNLLQLESGAGKAPPALRKVRSAAGVINLRSDGTPELAGKPFVVEELGDGRFDVKIDVNSEEEFARIVPHLAARMKMPEAEVWRQLSAVKGKVVSRRPGVTPFKLSFGGEDAVRSIAKSSLVLLATAVGTDPLRDAAFADAREFVLTGSGNFNHERASLDPRPIPGAFDLERDYGPLFNLIYVRSDADGRVVAHFTLYNVIAWQVVLAEANGPKNIKAGLISDPLNPANWSDRIAESADIDFAWLNTPDRTELFPRSTERFNKLLQHYSEVSRAREINRMIEAAMDRERPLGQPAILSEEQTQRVLAETIDRFAHMTLNVPYEEPFTPTPPKPEPPGD